MTALTEFLKTLGPARLGAMGAVAAGLIGFFAFLMLRLAEPQMATLFTDLEVRDSNQIISELDSANIHYELRNEGSTILIPKENVLRWRMQLAERGIPAGGSIGYELFDNQDAFGTTQFVQNLNHVRALEGELARTIRSLNRVDAARVHLVLPKRELFARDAEEPSASIALRVRGELNSGQIRAIQHLVATAVKSLSPARVSIVDETGRLLASGVGADDGYGMSATLDERNRAIEQKLERQIGEIVNSVVGRDRSRVKVTAELDYNRVTQTSDNFDPEGRVVRSTQVREENSAARNKEGNDAVTVGNELPGAEGNEGEGGAGSEETQNKSEEITNYEISRTTRTEIQEPGKVRRVSVAVLVDGTYTKNEDGSFTYAPRSQDELDQISTLIRSAIGYNQDRGDRVEVVNLQFAETPSVDELHEPGLFDLTKEDYFYIAELFVLLVVATLVLLLVVRPLVRRIITPDEPEVDETEVEAQLLGADGQPIDPDAAEVDELPESQAKRMIELAEMLGEEQAMTVRKIGEMVEGHPEEAVSIVRQWMHEAA